MEWMETNGVSLRYELAGNQPQTVLLVHELGGALDSFDESVGLFQRHFRTLRYDQRGFGHSEKVRGPIAMSDMVADIAGLLDGLGITTPVHVAGAGWAPASRWHWRRANRRAWRVLRWRVRLRLSRRI